METWILYNRNRERLGKEVARDRYTLDEEFHLSIHGWIKNKKGEYLIFQRDENKKIYPNYYEPISGGVDGEESSVEALIREVKEESGLEINERNIINVFTTINDKCKYHEICDVFVIELDYDVKDVTTEIGKNKNPRLINKEAIIKLINEGKFLPLVNYIDKIKEF